MDLTEDQWALLRPLFPVEETTQLGVRGRPYRDPRDVLHGVLWILRTGAPWKDMPARYPPYQTCHRRFQSWVRDGTLERVLHALAEDLKRRGKLDLTEAFIDGTHAGAKKGALWLGGLAAASRPRSWSFQTALVFLSPPGLKVVRALKSGPSRTPSRVASSERSPTSGLAVGDVIVSVDGVDITGQNWSVYYTVSEVMPGTTIVLGTQRGTRASIRAASL